MQPKKLTLLGLCSFTLILIAHTQEVRAASRRYPAIHPIQRVFNVPDVKKMNIRLLIRSSGGRPLYGLFCGSPDGVSQDKSPVHIAGKVNLSVDFGTYSGDFECRLASKLWSDMLFVENARQTKEWPSRGRFFSSDLKGACADIPNYGATRSFRLRGMKLTLQVIDPKLDSTKQGFGALGDSRLAAMKLKVTVRPDPSATRAIAAIVPFPKHPPPQCGINPGEWVVGALGALNRPLNEVSYFADPSEFPSEGRSNPPQPIDLDFAPMSKAGDWNQNMIASPTKPEEQAGGRCVSEAEAHNYTGRLIVRRFRVPALGKKPTPLFLLRLNKPVSVCNGPEGMTTIDVFFWDLDQIGGMNSRYVGHTVMLQGTLGAASSVEGIGALPTVPYSLMPNGICRVKAGKRQYCTGSASVDGK